jgi:biopolymer transport protein ExbB
MLTQFDWIGSITGSPIMVALICCSVLTLGVVLERAHFFMKRRGNPDETLALVLQKIRAGHVKEASWVSQKTAHPLGTVVARVFDHRGASSAEVEEHMQIALSEQKMLLERNLGFLGTMAAVAPLVGLLGTVWGIMRAFNDMAATGSAAPSVVAAGVAEALVTTAAGLVVAVPAVMLYNHFTRQMNVMLTVAENAARSVRSALHDTSVPNTPASSEPVSAPHAAAEKSNASHPRVPTAATSRVI